MKTRQYVYPIYISKTTIRIPSIDKSFFMKLQNEM